MNLSETATTGRADPPEKTHGKSVEFEDLLLSEGLVTEEQLTRARRVSARLQEPKSVGELLVDLGQLTRSEHDRLVRLYRSKLGIARVLFENAILDEEGLARYDAMKSGNPNRSERDILLGEGLVTEEQYLRALSAKHEIPFLEPDISLVDIALLTKVSVPYLLRQKAMPLRVVDGHLNVVMSDPLDAALIDELERTYGITVKPCAAVKAKIEEALRALERGRDTTKVEAATELNYKDVEEMPQDEDAGEGAVTIVDHLLSKAIETGASDLHIEPMETKVRARVRVDGVLHHLTDLPNDFAPRILSRIKVIAHMDIAERRLHQDGRFFVSADGRDVDIRVSSYASVFGETLVLRLLDRRRGLIPLDDLGFESRILAMLREIVLRSSSGLVLITGPTGSGKTTTMYSFVDFTRDDSLKVISCENPVEYVLDGTTQCSVNEKSGPNFTDSLRAIVRQDPDIIVVGEIRDGRTAELATESALTGHKVFSTFHTEDGVATVIRLLEMKVEPFLVASTLACIIAQRLVRRTCEACRRPVEPSKRDLRFLGLNRDYLRGVPLLEGAGCPKCGGTGYVGRIGIHEVLLLDDDFRDAILRRASSRDLRELAKRIPGFLTLEEDGLLKVAAGRTTLSELADNVLRDTDLRDIATIREVAALRRGR
jgi:type IV pilus assembly protein PilB